MSTSPDKSSTSGGVQLIARSAAILRVLNGKPNGLSLSDVSAEVNLPRSTVHRIITALAKEGLVMPVGPTGGYRLGPEILRLAISERLVIQAAIRPFLQELSDRTHETVDMGLLVRDQVYFVDQVVSSVHSLRAVSAVGESFPAWCNAGGKALLSVHSDEDLRRILPKKLPAFTPHSITDIDQLLEEIRTIRQTGIGYSREEYTEGICAVGVTIVAEPPGPVSSLSIPLPVQRFDANKERLGKLLARTARDIRREMQRLN